MYKNKKKKKKPFYTENDKIFSIIFGLFGLFFIWGVNFYLF